MEHFLAIVTFGAIGFTPIWLTYWILERKERKSREDYDRWLEEQVRLAHERRRQAYIDALLRKAMQEYHKPKNKTVYWWDFLGVPKDATKDEINRAYKQKAMVMHPDKGGSDKMMATLNKARELGLRGK